MDELKRRVSRAVAERIEISQYDPEWLAAREGVDRVAYTAGKSEFISAVMRRAKGRRG